MWPKTVEKYVEMVQQAAFKVEDLGMALEYDSESMSDAAVSIQAQRFL